MNIFFRFAGFMLATGFLELCVETNLIRCDFVVVSSTRNEGVSRQKTPGHIPPDKNFHTLPIHFLHCPSSSQSSARTSTLMLSGQQPEDQKHCPRLPQP